MLFKNLLLIPNIYGQMREYVLSEHAINFSYSAFLSHGHSFTINTCHLSMSICVRGIFSSIYNFLVGNSKCSWKIFQQLHTKWIWDWQHLHNSSMVFVNLFYYRQANITFDARWYLCSCQHLQKRNVLQLICITGFLQQINRSAQYL